MSNARAPKRFDVLFLGAVDRGTGIATENHGKPVRVLEVLPDERIVVQHPSGARLRLLPWDEHHLKAFDPETRTSKVRRWAQREPI
jgi:hypothetical protein